MTPTTLTAPSALRPAAGPVRPRATAPRVPVMDGFRALAVLWVFLFHLWIMSGRAPLDRGLFRALAAEGYLGVDLLFILSGFVLFLPVVANNGDIGSVRSYALRRAARIIPAYYAALVLVLAFHRVIAPAVPLPMPWDGWQGLWAFVSHLLFLQTYQLEGGWVILGYAYLAVTWTLTVEVTYYVLLPLVARPFERRPWLWAPVALGVSELWQAAVTPAGGIPLTGAQSVDLTRAVMSLPTYAGHFALGMAAACLFIRVRQRGTGTAWAAAMPVVQLATGAAIVGFVLHRAFLAQDANYLVQRMDTGYLALLLTGFMLASAMAPGWAQSPFANRVLAGFGDASYGIYLTHGVLISIASLSFGITPTGLGDTFFQLVFFTVPPAMMLGWLSCRFVEHPARVWARRRLTRASRTAAPAAGTVPPVRELAAEGAAV